MSKLKAYAATFSSFLITKLSEKDLLNNIENIILFGSVAEDRASKDSDVDIFVSVFKNSKKLEREISNIQKEFYKSREFLLYRTKGASNKINLIISRLDEWEDLQDSIKKTGIILWGKGIISKENISREPKIIFYWDSIGKNRGAFLNKIYGVKINGKKYKGLIELTNGKKLGKSCILIPIQHKNKFIDLFKKYKVNVKKEEIFS